MKSSALKKHTKGKKEDDEEVLSPLSKKKKAKAVEKVEESDKEEKKEEDKKEKEPLPSFVKRIKIVKETKYGDVTVREFEGIEKCEGSVMLEGFSGPGQAGLLAVTYIIEQLKLPLVGDVTCSKFAPLAVQRKGVPSNGIAIYGNEKITCVLSELEIDFPEVANNVIDGIIDLARRLKCPQLISTDGIPDLSDAGKKQRLSLKISRANSAEEEGGDDWEDVEEGEEGDEGEGEELALDDEDGEDKVPQTKEEFIQMIEDATKNEKIYFVTNEEGLGDRMLSLNCEPLPDSNHEGTITGGILARLPFIDFPIIVLFASLNKYLEVGLRAALRIINTLDRLVAKDLLIDTSELQKNAKDLEQKVKTLLQKIPAFGGAGGDKKAFNSMYN